MIEVPVSVRLKRCFDAGDTMALFPLLGDWPTEDLRALLADVDAYHRGINAAIEAAHKELAFKPENFLNRSRSKTVDDSSRDRHMEQLAMCSEICSVAILYLKQRGIGVPND
jgi:hypothetical protein